jgi:hypothetical protein
MKERNSMVIKVVEGASGPIEFRSFDVESAVELPSEEALTAFERELGVSLPEAGNGLPSRR